MTSPRRRAFLSAVLSTLAVAAVVIACEAARIVLADSFVRVVATGDVNAASTRIRRLASEAFAYDLRFGPTLRTADGRASIDVIVMPSRLGRCAFLCWSSRRDSHLADFENRVNVVPGAKVEPRSLTLADLVEASLPTRMVRTTGDLVAIARGDRAASETAR